MAIAVNQGHVARAVDFYKSAGKYFGVGRTTPWDNETTPTAPQATDFKIDEIIALKRVDYCHLVVLDDINGTISYRDNKWRIVQEKLETTVGSSVPEGSVEVVLQSLTGMVVGNKLRIANLYEGKIVSISTTNTSVTLDTPAPNLIPSGSPVLGGAFVEGANHVYVECTLSYESFPLATYRQIGLYTGVHPNTSDILRSAEWSATNINEYTDIGILEILDNRPPITRQGDQLEKLSIICQF